MVAFGIGVRGFGHEGAAFGILAYAPAMSVVFSIPRFRKKQSEWLRSALASRVWPRRRRSSVKSIAM